MLHLRLRTTTLPRKLNRDSVGTVGAIGATLAFDSAFFVLKPPLPYSPHMEPKIVR